MVTEDIMDINCYIYSFINKFGNFKWWKGFTIHAYNPVSGAAPVQFIQDFFEELSSQHS